MQNVLMQLVEVLGFDIVDNQMVVKQEINQEFLELQGEILLENGYEKQLDDLFFDDSIYVENAEYMISINLQGEVSIMSWEDF